MAPSSIFKRFNFTALVAIIVARFSRWLNSPCPLILPDGQRQSSQWIGAYGENVAIDWLRAKRITILARNYRGPNRGEVDIIARDGKLLLFIEVKTRQSNTRIRPYLAVTRKKQELIERGANAWLHALGTRRLPWRFDVIEVLLEHQSLPKVNHIRDAF